MPLLYRQSSTNDAKRASRLSQISLRKLVSSKIAFPRRGEGHHVALSRSDDPAYHRQQEIKHVSQCRADHSIELVIIRWVPS